MAYNAADVLCATQTLLPGAQCDLTSKEPRIDVSSTTGEVIHVVAYAKRKMRVVSRGDGIQVGCTFITNAAFDKLVAYHTKFNAERIMEHQS